MMEESIRNEIIQSLEVGKNYHFKSTYNGGGYDWSNLNLFSEPMRFEMEIIEAVETLGKDYMHLSKEGRKAYRVLCMKLHLYVE